MKMVSSRISHAVVTDPLSEDVEYRYHNQVLIRQRKRLASRIELGEWKVGGYALLESPLG